MLQDKRSVRRLSLGWHCPTGPCTAIMRSVSSLNLREVLTQAALKPHWDRFTSKMSLLWNVEKKNLWKTKGVCFKLFDPYIKCNFIHTASRCAVPNFKLLFLSKFSLICPFEEHQSDFSLLKSADSKKSTEIVILSLPELPGCTGFKVHKRKSFIVGCLESLWP